jgi:hypothetical protein
MRSPCELRTFASLSLLYCCGLLCEPEFAGHVFATVSTRVTRNLCPLLPDWLIFELEPWLPLEEPEFELPDCEPEFEPELPLLVFSPTLLVPLELLLPVVLEPDPLLPLAVLLLSRFPVTRTCWPTWDDKSCDAGGGVVSTPMKSGTNCIR